MSVRECARSQGFPDTFKLFGTILDKHRQVTVKHSKWSLQIQTHFCPYSTHHCGIRKKWTLIVLYNRCNRQDLIYSSLLYRQPHSRTIWEWDCPKINCKRVKSQILLPVFKAIKVPFFTGSSTVSPYVFEGCICCESYMYVVCSHPFKPSPSSKVLPTNCDSLLGDLPLLNLW